MEIITIEMSLDDVNIMIDTLKSSGLEEHEKLRLTTALEAYKNSDEFKTFSGWGVDDKNEKDVVIDDDTSNDLILTEQQGEEDDLS